MADIREIEARITAPGGPFEVVVEEVRGERLPVFKRRARSLRELLEASAGHGDREYVVCGDQRVSYASHFARASALGAALRDRYGVEPGDRVAILAANSPEWVLSFWATVAVGGVVAALNGWWQTDEVLYGVSDADPKLVIGDRKRLERLRGRDVGVPVLEIESDFAELEASAAGRALPPIAIAEDDPAVILYTSGTTGRPKGAVNSHRGICGFVSVGMYNGMRNLLHAMETGRAPAKPPTSPAMLVTVPLFHLSGLYAGCVTMLSVGGKAVYRPGRFDPEDVLRLIESERITSWSALGNMPHRVVSHPAVSRYDLSSINNIGSGGGPTSPEIQRRLREVFPSGGHNMGLGYGLSESVTAVAMITGDELIAHPTSVGRPVVTHEIEVRDPDGKTLPAGREGEIYIRSPYVMKGYWRKPEATRESLLPGCWLRTGDIGHFDAEGRLYINSRARDLILRGGENIYPVEIEHRLEAHPGVAEAAVVGVDHEELGQEVKAVVVPRDGARLDPGELAAFVAETLAAYKVPAHWEWRREPLPRNAAGKVLKNVLTGEAANAFVEE